jgi:hypothetical protein
MHEITSYFAAGIGRIAAFLPNVVSALFIAVAGYLLSILAARVTRRLCVKLGVDRLAARHAPTAAS